MTELGCDASVRMQLTRCPVLHRLCGRQPVGGDRQGRSMRNRPRKGQWDAKRSNMVQTGQTRSHSSPLTCWAYLVAPRRADSLVWLVLAKIWRAPRNPFASRRCPSVNEGDHAVQVHNRCHIPSTPPLWAGLTLIWSISLSALSPMLVDSLPGRPYLSTPCSSTLFPATHARRLASLWPMLVDSLPCRPCLSSRFARRLVATTGQPHT